MDRTKGRRFAEAQQRIDECATREAVSLDLRGLGLTELPERLYGLDHLRRINLGGNNIGAEGAKGLSALSALTSLNLGGNNIGAEGAKALASLNALRTLNLGGNRIGNEGAKALSSLCALTTLFLYDNDIGDDGAKTLSTLRALTILHLYRNKIGDMGATALAELGALTTLLLDNNSIGSAGAKALAGLSNLTVLDLTKNSIGEGGATALASLSSLTELNLGGSRVGAEGVKALAALSALTTLRLANNSIGSTGVKALARLSSLTTLDLSNNVIGNEGAKALAPLRTLTVLHLSNNSIGDDGAKALSALSALTTLNLIGNRIREEGAKALAKLPTLTTLHLSGNRIGDAGARALAELPVVTSLNLAGSGIGDEGAKALSPLSTLTNLDLRINGIGDEGAKAFATLPALMNLNLAGNRIGDEGVQALAALSALSTLDLSDNNVSKISCLTGLSKLSHIHLHGCRLAETSAEFWLASQLSWVSMDARKSSILGVPIELLSRSAGDNCLSRLRAHFLDLKGRKTRIDDIKVMLLGNGRVGKTQIRRRLCDEPFEVDANSTHGIQIRSMVLSSHDASSPSTNLRIWDFGGQDIYLGTHALFLRSRAVFPIVWTISSEEVHTYEYGGLTFRNYPLDYWVRYVAMMTGNKSALLLVQNKCDRAEDDAVFPQADAKLLAQFGFKRSGIHYSALNKRGHAILLDALNQSIDWLKKTHGTVEIGFGRAAVKRHLEKMQETAQGLPTSVRENRWMTRTQFDVLCAVVGKESGRITDTSALLDYLHHTGTIFWQEDLFDGHIVVDQAWALDAIYAVFDHESGLFSRIRDRQLGRFTLSDICDGVWDALGHERTAQELFLSMMKSCGICFTLRAAESTRFGETVYVAPDMLPDKESLSLELVQKWDDEAMTNEVLLNYDFLPPGLLRTLMARIGEQFGLAADYWRNGFYLFESTTRARALVERARNPTEGHPWGGSIRLRTQQGEAPDLLKQLCQFMDDLHRRIGVEPTSSGEPDDCTVDDRYVTAKLVASERPDGVNRNLDMSPGYERPLSAEYYVSYAWGGDLDEADRERAEAVERLCRRAKDQGVSVIRDCNIVQFGDSLLRFMDRLVGGDRIYVILSGKYLRSPNCMYELYNIYAR